jgi:nicotinamidase/pyrazinamidase
VNADKLVDGAQHSVLIVVDVQNGFMPGGGLPVPRGDEVVPVIS